jgi:L-2-amino-thiazoline-4-carboxylic acid hydrolase-like protein
MADNIPPDRLNEIGVLKRREIEARILAPMINAFAAEFGRARVIEIAKRVIVEIARQQGKALADQAGGDTLAHFAGSKDAWVKGGALETQILQVTDTAYDFNVTRCRYADMYRALGIPELGSVLSCGRDFSLGEGFNSNLKLTRTQTIMEGAPFCDFRYRLEAPPDPKEP